MKKNNLKGIQIQLCAQHRESWDYKLIETIKYYLSLWPYWMSGLVGGILGYKIWDWI